MNPEAGKLAMEPKRSIGVGGGSLFLCGESAEAHGSPINVDEGSPRSAEWRAPAVMRDALVAGGVVGAGPGISKVLAPGGQSHVAPATVQTIPIDVVNVEPSSGFEDHSVQVAAATYRIPKAAALDGKPLQLGNLGVAVIEKRGLTLCQRYLNHGSFYIEPLTNTVHRGTP